MKTNEKNRIGENIRNLRREREVKQITLALVTLPDIYLLIRIADYFDVTLDELTGRER